MKEFLDTEKLYTYIKDTAKRSEDWIDIPDGAEVYLDNKYFYKLGYPSKVYLNEQWDDVAEGYHTVVDFINGGDCILWQREKVEAELDNVSEKLSKVDETLKERQSQYGCFEDVAFVTQGFIEIMSKCKYKEMPQPHQMALYMIASKMARLVNGDFNHVDSWHDIGGYAKLIEDLIGE